MCGIFIDLLYMTELDEACVTEQQLNVTSLYNGSVVSTSWSRVSNAERYTVYWCEMNHQTRTCQVYSLVVHSHTLVLPTVKIRS